uniref:Pre-mRNA-processing factor 19 n=1 Tax=Glossina palpalis gambiensis TaxID=67801 RepID=A0A1B0AKF2_9MUSC
MSLICAITNEVPDIAVVSPFSGAIFEKRIIEKYITENGCDPINGKEMKIEDLIEVKTPPIVKSKPPSATSIPATLKTMQDEWDALILHLFTQRQKLQTTRQELSHALYQHDAACRVIARLNKEVAAAHEALATLKPQEGIGASIASTTIPQPAIAAEAGGIATQPVEKTGMSTDVIQKLQDKPTLLTQERKKRGRTNGTVTGLSFHPTGDYVLSTSSDKHWAFSDIRTDRLLTKVIDTAEVGLTTAQFHPDGLIFGTGTDDSHVKIWDLKEQSNVANFPGHTGPISANSFSENGYYLATAADDACVKLWDLRKLKNFKTIQLDDGYEVKDLCFDQSGTYLAIAGTDVRVYLSKQWQDLKIFNIHTTLATGVRFGKHARYIASTSMDRTLKLYAVE